MPPSLKLTGQTQMSQELYRWNARCRHELIHKRRKDEDNGSFDFNRS
jgi:hypothetical protein